MNLETYTRAQMVRFAVEEAEQHGGINNMLAVLHVLRNRVFAGWGDWLEVVTHAAEKRAVIYTPHIPNLRSMSARIVLNRIDDIYTRTDSVDLTGGALFYMEQNQPLEEWFQKEVLGHPDEHPRVAHIGPVWFFK
jgi:hypothetical protein